jgi:hypothetical protein
MATELERTEEIVDSAVGALSVVQTTATGLDIDDFVSSAVVSQATYMQMVTLVNKVDPRYVKGRTKVTFDGVSVGGY